MEKRILAIGIVSLFLITGLTTISATQLPGSAITIPQKNIPRPANVNHTTVEMIITDGHAEKTLFLTIFRPPVHKFFTAVFMTGGTITIKDLTGKIIEEYHLTENHLTALVTADFFISAHAKGLFLRWHQETFSVDGIAYEWEIYFTT